MKADWNRNNPEKPIFRPTGEHCQVKLVSREFNNREIYLDALVGYSIGRTGFVEFVRYEIP
jgi:hypothetical protein